MCVCVTKLCVKDCVACDKVVCVKDCLWQSCIKLCVKELCMTKLCVKELCMTKLFVTKLCVKDCVCDKVVCV